MKKQKTMGNKGFSLVELIVVIAIMAVLVGVLAPQFIKYVERSRESTDVQNIDQIISTVEVYVASSDTATLDGLSITNTTAGTKTLTLDATTTAALADAGISAPALKSGKWDVISISYNTTDKKVTYSGTAEYYNIDGTTK